MGAPPWLGSKYGIGVAASLRLAVWRDYSSRGSGCSSGIRKKSSVLKKRKTMIMLIIAPSQKVVS